MDQKYGYGYITGFVIMVSLQCHVHDACRTVHVGTIKGDAGKSRRAVLILQVPLLGACRSIRVRLRKTMQLLAP